MNYYTTSVEDRYLAALSSQEEYCEGKVRSEEDLLTYVCEVERYLPDDVMYPYYTRSMRA